MNALIGLGIAAGIVLIGYIVKRLCRRYLLKKREDFVEIPSFNI